MGTVPGHGEMPLDQAGFPGCSALTQLLANVHDGVGVLDEQVRFVYLNQAGREILGGADLLGGSSLPLRPADGSAPPREALRELLGPRAGRRTLTILRGDGRKREIEYTATPLEIDGRRLVAGIFRDVTEARRAERWATAFARITAEMASTGAPQAFLEELARAVVGATGMVGCAAILLDPDTGRFRLAGAHGLPTAYQRRLSAALADGADLPAVDAFRGTTTIVLQAPDDPVLEEAPSLAPRASWNTIVCAPMRVGERTVGVLQGLLPPSVPPEADVLAFVDAIGDQTAVALENSRLFVEATETSRRQEALVQAGLSLASELSLPTVLSKIVESACDVAGATYGALGVLDAQGGLESFITHGVTDEQRTAIGHLPVGRGLLGALITDARPMRLERLQDDPRSGGFPANHPPMSSFLGVPITVRGLVYGNLYLTEKRDAPAFTEADEIAVVTLAAQAGVAIENARLFAEAQGRLALEERTRLAHELHDSVSQALFAMTLETGAAQLALARAGSDPGGLSPRLERLRGLTEGALAEMRALIFALRPDAIREEGLVAAIRKETEALAAREDLEVAVQAPEHRIPLAPNTEEQLYRLIQEALSNVAKHAGARRVEIRVRRSDGDPDRLALEVEDDGVGFDPTLPHPGHLGLGSMRKRAAGLGGTFEISSQPGRGTLLRAVVPMTGSGSDRTSSTAAT